MEFLTNSPLLTLFLVVAPGAVLDAIPSSPLRLGAADTLFVGTIVGFYVPRHGPQMALVQQLGLALFVYGVGLSAGQTFSRNPRKQYKLILTTALSLVATVAVTVLGGLGLGMRTESSVSVFAGALTATPALAAATDLTGSRNPAVGYSLTCPAGVVIEIIMVGSFVTRRRPGQRNTPALVGQKLQAVTAVVSREIGMRDVPGWLDQSIRMSCLHNGDSIRIVAPGQILNKSDQAVVVGLPTGVDRTVTTISYALPEHLASDYSVVEFQSFIVSRSRITGSTVADLNLVAHFGAVVTRIKRDDIETLATNDKTVELGDRLFVTYPREEERNLAAFFGDSRNSVAQVDTIALGLGIARGVLLGTVKISLPGGSSLQLGSAAGPLVVDLILGYLRRTGPIVWQLPQGANLTVCQLGLMLFLAATGISSGPVSVKMAFTELGMRAGLLGVLVATVTLVVIGLAGRVLGLSTARATGSMAGSLGQPALLAYTQSRTDGERIETSYATILASGAVLKVILVSVVLLFQLRVHGALAGFERRFSI